MTKRWYIIHAYSNFEKKVAESVQERASLSGIEDLIEEIIVPTEEVVELRRGERSLLKNDSFLGMF
jgi:transcriptional antiterminator NusG